MNDTHARTKYNKVIINQLKLNTGIMKGYSCRYKKLYTVKIS